MLGEQDLRHHMGRNSSFGAFALATAFTVVTYPVYDNGFWGAKGLNTIADYEALEEMRTQPIDVHVHEENEFTMQFGYDDLMVPTMAWLDWGRLSTNSNSHHRLFGC